jgi:hypothetical protein
MGEGRAAPASPSPASCRRTWFGDMLVHAKQAVTSDGKREARAHDNGNPARNNNAKESCRELP